MNLFLVARAVTADLTETFFFVSREVHYIQIPRVVSFEIYFKRKFILDDLKLTINMKVANPTNSRNYKQASGVF